MQDLIMSKELISFVLAVCAACPVACNRSQDAAPELSAVATSAPTAADPGTGAPAAAHPAAAAAPASTPMPGAAHGTNAAPASHAATTAAAETTAAPQAAKPGTVGTCAAMRPDGSLIAVEIAPTSASGVSHDYPTCQKRLEPKIKAAVCGGKTSHAPYLSQIAANPATKSEMICK